MCTDCENEKLCDSCLKIHKFQKGTAQHHVVYDLGDQTEETESMKSNGQTKQTKYKHSCL